MSVEVSEKESKYDYYGFSNNYEYDRKVDYPVFKPKISSKNTFLIVIVSLIALFWIAGTGISGYYAWYEFPNDPIRIKFIRLCVATIFAPIYLFYIFMKTTVFKET